MKGALETGFDSEGHLWDMEQENRLWKWRKYTKRGMLEKESDRTFDTREECLSDARSHGLDNELMVLVPAMD